MKKLSKNLAMYICMFVAVFCAMTLRVEAANVTTGRLGPNGGITWTYDADTKTLTITGKDSGLMGVRENGCLNSRFLEICGDVEVIRLKDCTPVGNVAGAFAYLESLKRVEFDNVDTSNVTDMYCMFEQCSSLTQLDLSGFDTSQVICMSYMFSGCSSLTQLDLSGFDTSQVIELYYMFNNCSSLTQLNLSGFDTSHVDDMGYMFNGCSSLTQLDLSSFDTSQVKHMGYMFNGCSSLTQLDLSSFNTSRVKGMNNMFSGCSSLMGVNLTSFDTSQVLNMEEMFSNCSSLTQLNVSGFNTSQANNVYNMFGNCSSLTQLDVSNFDTSQVIDMGGMFSNCSSLTQLDVSGFDTSNVVYIDRMFRDCSRLTQLDVSGFDTSNVVYADHMFNNCSSLTQLDVSNFDTSQMKYMYGVFSNCSSLIQLDISGFVFTGNVHLGEFMSGSKELRLIYTPKTLTENQSIMLPGTFADLNRNQTTVLNKDFCNTTLINVKNLMTGLKITPESVELKAGEAKQMGVSMTPANVAIKELSWKSSDTAVATVDANGKVTAVGEGTVTITATAKDGTGISASCKVTVTDPLAEQKRLIKAFVERMYTVALGRASDPSGINYWTEELLSHRKDGASISEGFIMSEEFEKKNYSNEEYLKVLYRTFFNREADAGGKAFWLEQMSAGRSRKSVLAGFVNSKEFTEICESYGINRGTMEDDATATGAGQFVERLYTIALERPSDPAGLKDWADRINNRTNTPEQVAKEFFLSPEYTAKNTSNDKYVETLYLVFMDRASEAGGKAYWVEQLNNGMSREAVLEGFAQSEEFKEIMARYGL